MNLLFLGVGAGLGREVNIFQSNMVLTGKSSKRLLIDCGTDIRFSLANANLSPEDLDAVYISHLHADHVGGLEWLAFSRKFASEKPKIDLIIHASLRERLWRHRLSGAMETLKEEQATLESFFNVILMKDNESLSWHGIHLSLVKTEHVISNNVHLPSYGIAFSEDGANYFITSDTKFTPELLMPFYQGAAIIFQDCETSQKLSGVHANYQQLIGLDSAIKSKMWLYHYNEGVLPDAISAGFAGFVSQGQLFDLP